MFDAECPRAFEKPVHRGAVERARASQAIGPRHPCQQFEVNFLRQSAKCTVADVARFLEHARFQVMCDKAQRLAAHVKAIQ